MSSLIVSLNLTLTLVNTVVVKCSMNKYWLINTKVWNNPAKE